MKEEAEALNELKALLSLPAEERDKRISALGLAEVSKFEKFLIARLDELGKIRWREDFLKKALKERLEKEGWQITSFSLGRTRGKDLEACKAGWTIIFEVKGEPVSSKTASGQRIKYIGDALLSLLAHMTAKCEDVRYCMVFPDRYVAVVKKRLSHFVRAKVGLNIMFLSEGGSLKALLAEQDSVFELRAFEELFKR